MQMHRPPASASLEHGVDWRDANTPASGTYRMLGSGDRSQIRLRQAEMNCGQLTSAFWPKSRSLIMQSARIHNWAPPHRIRALTPTNMRSALQSEVNQRVLPDKSRPANADARCRTPRSARWQLELRPGASSSLEPEYPGRRVAHGPSAASFMPGASEKLTPHQLRSHMRYS